MDALGAHIFTFDQWGDYLIYRLYPRTRVFIDGRSDFYGAAFEALKYIDALNVKYEVGRHPCCVSGVDTIFIAPDGVSLTGAALEDVKRLASIVYDDGVALVFRSAALPAGPTAVTAAGDIPVSTIPAMDPRKEPWSAKITKTEASDQPIKIVGTKTTT